MDRQDDSSRMHATDARHDGEVIHTRMSAMSLPSRWRITFSPLVECVAGVCRLSLRILLSFALLLSLRHSRQEKFRINARIPPGTGILSHISMSLVRILDVPRVSRIRLPTGTKLSSSAPGILIKRALVSTLELWPTEHMICSLFWTTDIFSGSCKGRRLSAVSKAVGETLEDWLLMQWNQAHVIKVSIQAGDGTRKMREHVQESQSQPNI